MKIRLFKNSLVQRLKDSVSENLERYKTGEFSEWLSHEYEADFFEVDLPGIDALNLDELNARDGKVVSDDADVRILFGKLSAISPSLARDPRLWTTLCHVYALPYIRRRNPQILTGSPEEVLNTIVSRFFIVGGGRGFERTNALARLWWYGYIARKTGVNFDHAIHALVENTGHRADTIERPGLAVCGNYMTAMTEVLVSAKQNNDKFFDSRSKYRPMLMAVFETAGRKFFPAMDSEAIRRDIEEQIELHRS